MSSAPPPSAEVLGDLARRVADAYPDLYTHQRSGIAFLLSRRREIHLVEPDADVHVVTGSGGWEPGHRWTVINYDLLGRLEADLQSVRWAGIVVDEAHYIKNRSYAATAPGSPTGATASTPGRPSIRE